MVIPITTLWLPILVAAVLVFVGSSIIHMLLPYHRSDFRRLPEEDQVMQALRAFDLPPGDYVMPFAGGAEALRSEAFREKVTAGPAGFLTVLRPGTVLSMAPQLVQWFAYSLLVGIFAAYLAGRLLPAGEDYLQVFRVTGTMAFACYSVALMQRSIWYGRSWTATLKDMLDGLVYAALTAGTFGWLWPA